MPCAGRNREGRAKDLRHRRCTRAWIAPKAPPIRARAARCAHRGVSGVPSSAGMGDPGGLPFGSTGWCRPGHGDQYLSITDSMVWSIAIGGDTCWIGPGVLCRGSLRSWALPHVSITLCLPCVLCLGLHLRFRRQAGEWGYLYALLFLRAPGWGRRKHFALAAAARSCGDSSWGGVLNANASAPSTRGEKKKPKKKQKGRLQHVMADAPAGLLMLRACRRFSLFRRCPGVRAPCRGQKGLLSDFRAAAFSCKQSVRGIPARAIRRVLVEHGIGSAAAASFRHRGGAADSLLPLAGAVPNASSRRAAPIRP